MPRKPMKLIRLYRPEGLVAGITVLACQERLAQWFRRAFEPGKTRYEGCISPRERMIAEGAHQAGRVTYSASKRRGHIIITATVNPDVER